MDAFLQSFFLVGAAEMGDKTQILALILTLRYRQPWLIMLAIFVATIANHALASYLGGYLSTLMSASGLRYLLAAVFAVFALLLLMPERSDATLTQSRYGPFLTTLVSFLLAEMGDKTQLVTLALGARFQAPLTVTIGTTLGTLAADGLAVYFGKSLVRHVSMIWIRRGAATLFAVFGLSLLISQ